jgi:hypothetical protein
MFTPMTVLRAIRKMRHHTYAPDVARYIIEYAVLDCAGIKVSSPQWQSISYCYHVLFHGKLVSGAANGPLTRQFFRNSDGFSELERLVGLAGRPLPYSVDDLEAVLRDAAASPRSNRVL